ncbi:hypothetical protein [Paenibacillus methanolicus]|uniref:Uncharacterized protein n=1 Tax=Paenibacillus methanolicus TaxID=582686 RepID=A0A5S5BQD5_9BACL|nr:hypothetical protein [Paenibacillus methanolicus]TYP69411.1 hypothetical protein BCM02_11571 [Paenibacillus methanolicus]
MKSAGWKMLKWPLLAGLVVVVLVICSGWTHGGMHGPRGGHEAGFGRGGSPFLGGGSRIEQGIRGGQGGGFSFAHLLLKIGVLLIGAALLAKGKSVLKWGGALIALLALWSLLSFWTIAITALAIAAYVYMRRRTTSNDPLELTASAEWLAPSPAHNQVHILDQWERQLDKEANN